MRGRAKALSPRDEDTMSAQIFSSGTVQQVGLRGWPRGRLEQPAL
jgi:hypothetical protein